MDLTAVSRHASLYEALWSLVTDEGATLVAIAEQPALLNLAVVVERVPATAAGDPVTRAERARAEIVAACQDLRDLELAVEERFVDEGDAALVALGLATGHRNAPLWRRKPAVAVKLGEVVDTAWRERPGKPSYVQRLIAKVADQLLAREARHRVRTSGLTAMASRPELAEMSAQMMRRYEAYYRVYSDLEGLRADTYAALDLRDIEDDGFNRFEDFVGSSLYFYARFLLDIEYVIREYGGIWIFGDAEVEQSVADAIKLIEHFSEVPYRDESKLRLRAAAAAELDSFLGNLEAESAGRALLERWQRRLRRCQCKPTQPDLTRCKVHQMTHACAYYTHVLDIDWYRMVPWHGEAPPNLDLVDPATLYRDLGLTYEN